MRIKIFILALFISLNLWAQKEGFVIRGYIPGMPDGVKVTLMEKEGKRSTWKSHATLTLLATQDCPLWLQYD